MKNFFLVLIAAVVFTSCKKDNECETPTPTTVASAGETTALQNYLNANGITTAQSRNGMFFEITNPGTGTSPNLCNTVNVDYTGNIINGTSNGPQFDAGTAVSLGLANVIAGWQLILPMLRPGGTVNLYIPPSLGYGSQAQTNASGAVIIPANSYLKFVIKVNSVN